MHGTVKSEREIELETRVERLEREKREAETKAAELERDNQNLKSIPAAPAPKLKGKRWQRNPENRFEMIQVEE
jgi:predicted RNase H-like nuclease (RuvC/YqgF family)